MIPTFRAGLLATAMATIALLPAAGITVLVSADAAHARGEGNGNGNGGGNGNGNGGGNRGNGGEKSEARGSDTAARGGGRPDWAGSRGAGADRGNGRSDPISNFIRGLTGEQKRAARAESGTQTRAVRQATTERAPQVSIAPVARPEKVSGMHPSELGNMNGALNANMNAVLAHIRNGNTNGPVGQMAALAVAKAEAADAAELLSSPDVEDYRDLQTAVEQGGFKNLEEYLEARETEGENPEIEEALADIPSFDEERYTEYLAARDAEADLLAAQESILAYWNKNPDPSSGITDENELLLDTLMSRFDGYETEIAEAIAATEARAAAEGDVADETSAGQIAAVD